MTPRQVAGSLAAFASIDSLWGGGRVLLLRWPPGRDGPTGARRRVEAAALRPDRAHLRPLDGPPPAAARRGIAYVPIDSTLHPGERETRVGPAATLGVRDTSPDREPVVHRVDGRDTAGKLARRRADRLHAVPAPAEFFIDRDDSTGDPGANDLVGWSVPKGGSDPPIEAVLVGRSDPTSTSLVGRGVSPGGGAAPAAAAA